MDGYAALFDANGEFVRKSDTLLLQAVLGGTQGLEVFIQNFSLDPTGSGYTATLVFQIRDDFGVDETDLDPLKLEHGSPGLVAFWILQHERTPANIAFINTVTVETPISGTF